MLRADELYNEVTQDVASKGAAQGMFIGCFVDTATGWITFTCEGKETKHRFKVHFISIRSERFAHLCSNPCGILSDKQIAWIASNPILPSNISYDKSYIPIYTR